MSEKSLSDAISTRFFPLIITDFGNGDFFMAGMPMYVTLIDEEIQVNLF